ncbi:MAG: SOS response-associated peptidase family protein, partial [Candidatus Altiarchaeota archaeon]
HDRMPVILGKENEASWLSAENHDIDKLKSMLAPYPAEEMKAVPVSPDVGNPENNNPEILAPIQEPKDFAETQKTLGEYL